MAMRFDLVDLQLFIAVAETRSITNGAERVHLALASASERIKGLEAGVRGCAALRGRRGVELTAAGESLLDHARIVIHNVEALQGDLADLPGGSRRPSASSPIPRVCRNICRRRWRPSSASTRTSRRRRGARKRRDRTCHRDRRRRAWLRRRARAAGQDRADPVQRRPPRACRRARRRTGAGGRSISARSSSAILSG